jgi:hypothetical protein
LNFARRLEKLEKAQGTFDVHGIATMNGEELREYIAATLQALGGRDAALSALRAHPVTDSDTIKMVEAWPAWPL